MSLNIRQKSILDQLTASTHCSISELAQNFQVTEETIRRDVRQMEEKNLVQKFHGGVRLPEHNAEGSFYQRLKDGEAIKHQIGQQVAALIPNDISVFIDSGSTSYYAAKWLRNHKGLSVITNSLEVAQELKGQDMRIFLAGGELDASYGAFFGSATLEFVRQFRPDFAIMSITSISSQGDFSDTYLPETEFKQAVLPLADKVIMAADAGKFDQSGLMVTATPKQVDYLVTNKRPRQELAKTIESVEIIVATPMN
ncbi:DeoR/GlpR family DNA-binding transcription regulator [Porticoccus sp. GXU_MW_L64]